MAVNRFVLNNISYHGAGAIKEIPGEIQRRGYKKAFVSPISSMPPASPGPSTARSSPTPPSRTSRTASRPSRLPVLT